jgi:hypothetical protein
MESTMPQVVGGATRTWLNAEFDQLFDLVNNWGRWEPNDANGTLDYIAPEGVCLAPSLVHSGRSISLSRSLEAAE